MAFYLVNGQILQATSALEAAKVGAPPTPDRPRKVQRVVRVEQCIGAAHSNAHIDHCSLCLSVMWGWMRSDVQASDADIADMQSAIRDALNEHCGNCYMETADGFAKIVQIAAAAALNVKFKRTT